MLHNTENTAMQCQLIRTEIPIDATAIDLFLRRNDPTNTHANLIQRLREDGLLTLSLVAVDEQDQVCGYIAFSSTKLQQEDHALVALIVLTVEEKVQESDFACRLIVEGLNSLLEFGYCAVVVNDSAPIFAHIGFIKSRHLTLKHSGHEENTLMIYPLQVERVNQLRGEIVFPA